ncbi:MAG: bifunctional nuclease family protein [Planctomycetota bacterium]
MFLRSPLIRQILDALETTLIKIVVCDLKDGTFYAHLYLNQEDRLFKVDCRPSDAIALACALDVPIFVEEHVMDQVGRVEGSEEF